MGSLALLAVLVFLRGEWLNLREAKNPRQEEKHHEMGCVAGCAMGGE